MTEQTPRLTHRYHELMSLRSEALRRYRANEFSTIAGPPSRLFLPHFSLQGAPRVQARIGPLSISDRPPIQAYAIQAIESLEKVCTILEIGPGDGRLAHRLQERFGAKIQRYVGIELDASVRGPYERVDSVSQIDFPVDVVIASEVAEHMTADEWYADFLVPLSTRISRRATLVMSVPNPICPGGIARDFTHVQNYPWYDLYALMRLVFGNVDIYRTYYAWSAQRILCLLPRMLMCPMLELDWCDGIVCMASNIIPGTIER